MTITRKIIEIDEERCDGCGQCVPACAEGAIQIIDGKAKVINDRFCDGLGACLGECPREALKLVERKAEAFDEAAVEAHLEEMAQTGEKQPAGETLACGCPSSRLQTFASPESACQTANQPAAVTGSASNLGHWPVQIRLIPPEAPFLKNADLVVAADCVPVAYPDFQANFLAGRTVMIGCPKFDNLDEYLEKFTAIFQTADIRRVTVLIMEVPCCAGLPGMLKKALARAGKDLPVHQVTISSRGKVINEVVL